MSLPEKASGPDHAADRDALPSALIIVLLLVLAAVARALFLYYNLSLDFAPAWTWGARWGLAAALSDFGALDSYDYIAAEIPQQEVVVGWQYSDRGIAYPHLLIKFLTGTSSWTALQALHLVLDTLMIIPIVSIAAMLGGRRATILSGAIYALFLPQIWLAANPSYPTWLTFGFIISTWAFLHFTRHSIVGLAAWGSLILIVFAVAIANEFRSVISLYGIAMPLWLALVTGVAWFRGRRPRSFGRQFIGLALAGILVLIAAGAANYALRGDWKPVRSTLGHSFWCGVGQFDNPYGIGPPTDLDGDVARFYARERGVPLPVNLFDMEYNGWLMDRAKQFVREQPGLYLSMVARRSLKLLLPTPIVQLTASSIAYSTQPEVRKKTEIRQNLVATYGLLSLDTIGGVIKSDPGYAISTFVRVVIMVSLPIGVFAALLWGSNRRRIALACLPWAYCVVTISPIFGPQQTIVSLCAAMIPVVATGLVLGAARGRRLFRGI